MTPATPELPLAVPSEVDQDPRPYGNGNAPGSGRLPEFCDRSITILADIAGHNPSRAACCTTVWPGENRFEFVRNLTPEEHRTWKVENIKVPKPGQPLE